jgi:hypothetical protein
VAFHCILKNKVLHDIQRLDEERAEKGQDQGQVFKMFIDSNDQRNSRY